MEKDMTIYNMSLQKGSEMMRGILDAQSLDKLKRCGDDLQNIINSYEPENSRNEGIFQNAQTIATCVMGYVARISRVAGGKRFAPLIMKYINKPESITPASIPLIAFKMSKGNEEERSSAKCTLEGTLEAASKCTSSE